MFCPNCGSQVNGKADVCLSCGCAVQKIGLTGSSVWIVTVLLCVFLGCIGAHRFYTGHKEIGIFQLLITIFTCYTLGWIWPFIDLILLLCEDYKMSDGQILLRQK